jgi:hypothetical protein
MTLESEQRNIIEAIVTGLPHLAEALSAIPAEYQARALEAAERSYLKAFRRLGLSEPKPNLDFVGHASIAAPRCEKWIDRTG